jgi:hypothetical protein
MYHFVFMYVNYMQGIIFHEIVYHTVIVDNKYV